MFTPYARLIAVFAVAVLCLSPIVTATAAFAADQSPDTGYARNGDVLVSDPDTGVHFGFPVGRIAGQVSDDPAMLALHLTDRSDVALYLFLDDDDEGERGAAAVVLVTDEPDPCRYPYEGSLPFVVRLDQADAGEVAGAYAGRVRCDDPETSIQVQGTFRVPR